MELISLLLMAESGADRRSALLRAALFVVLAFVSALIITGILKRVARVTFADLSGASISLQLGAKFGLFTAFVLLPTLALMLMFREPLERFGWSAAAMGRGIGLGALTGIVAFLATIAGIALFSRITVSLNPASTSTILSQFALSLLVWTAGALIEEATFRGYPLIQLSRAWSFWPAALLSSLVFALIHVDRAANPLLSALSVGLVGLILCYSVRIFGSIWFAVAFHMSWNFLQSFVFGVKNSGKPPPAFLSSWSFEGPAWITGGQVGPEGSIVAVLVLAATFLAVVFVLPRWLS
jgi:hypothetical protein